MSAVMKTIASLLITALLGIFTFVVVSPQKLLKQKTTVQKNKSIKSKEDSEDLFI